MILINKDIYQSMAICSRYIVGSAKLWPAIELHKRKAIVDCHENTDVWDVIFFGTDENSGLCIRFLEEKDAMKLLSELEASEG